MTAMLAPARGDHWVAGLTSQDTSAYEAAYRTLCDLAWAARNLRRPDGLLELLEQVAPRDHRGHAMRAVLAVAQGEHDGVLVRAAAYLLDERAGIACRLAVLDVMSLARGPLAERALRRVLYASRLGDACATQLSVLVRAVTTHAVVAEDPLPLTAELATHPAAPIPVRLAALETLALLRDARSRSVLIEIFEDPDRPSLRRAAARAIAALGSDEDIGLLARAARAGEPGARLDAVRALSACPGLVAEEALGTALCSSFATVRQSALVSLARRRHLDSQQRQRISQLRTRETSRVNRELLARIPEAATG